MIISIRSYLRFMFTIIYIYDTQNLNTICNISYFNILPLFFCNISITTYMLLFWSAYTVPLHSPVVYYSISTIHLPFLRPIKRKYSLLSFDYIAFSANNRIKRCVVVIYRHKGKVQFISINTTDILFIEPKWYSGQNKVTIYYIPSLCSKKCLILVIF